MHYDFFIDITAGTALDKPFPTEYPIPLGILTKITVIYPTGTWRTGYLRILLNEKQIYPTNQDGWIRGDNYPIEWEDYLPLDGIGYFKFLTAAPNAINNHQVYIGIAIKPYKKDMTIKAIHNLTDSILKLYQPPPELLGE